MKKMVLAGLMLGLASALFAIDFNVDAGTDLIYTTFRDNSAYNAMAASITAMNIFEKLRIKAKANIESVRFDFDGRVYLKPSAETLTYTIDGAYFSFETGPLIIYAGKQRLKWGTGYFWNPSDKLQPVRKDIFRTSEELEGIFAFRAEYTNDFVTPSLILVPEYDANSRNFFALQLYKLVGTCDIFVNYIHKRLQYGIEYTSVGAAISWDLGMVVFNAEAALEYSYNDGPYQFGTTVDSNQQVPDFVAGLSKTIGDLFFDIEYYRKNSGMDNAWYTWMVETSGYGPAMNKIDYIAYTASYTWDQRFAFALTGMHGLDDGTFYLFPSISYMENQNFDVQLSLMQNLTEKGINEGNYSTPFYSVVELRLNAYF